MSASQRHHVGIGLLWETHRDMRSLDRDSSMMRAAVYVTWLADGSGRIQGYLNPGRQKPAGRKGSHGEHTHHTRLSQDEQVLVIPACMPLHVQNLREAVEKACNRAASFQGSAFSHVPLALQSASPYAAACGVSDAAEATPLPHGQSGGPSFPIRFLRSIPVLGPIIGQRQYVMFRRARGCSDAAILVFQLRRRRGDSAEAEPRRNRAAAHNSRERKRLEAEQLSVANDGLNRTIEHLKRQLAMRDAQLAKCKELIPGGIPQIPSEDFGSLPFDMSDESSSVQTPGSSYTIDPRASLTPGDAAFIKSEIKMESPASSPLPPPANFTDATTQRDLDQTQHSAAMLWDLQCQSSPRRVLAAVNQLRNCLPEYNPGPLDGLSQQDEQPIDSHFADLINFDENATFTTDLFFNDHATQLDHFGALYACDGSGLSAGL
ncbi:transcription factor that binds to CRE motif [Zalaria obscura]|uniref:Transcription factor that binds to CRE motif n=1 Tax=Zalaria obscura TaxID=2024903 RepID=A0ACC3S473_9PEZI